MSRTPNPQWNPELSAVMDKILGGKVKFKTAAEVGRRAVFYCRGEDLYSWVEENKDMLVKNHSNALDGQKLDSSDSIIEFCDKLLRFGFLLRAQYQPLDGVIERDQDGNFKRPKWPKRLAMTSKQQFDVSSFYVSVYEGSKSWQHFMLFLLIAGILAVCMFPAWPLKLKLGVWYLTIVFLTLIIIIVILRLVVFTIFWFGGYHCWILPNMFNDDAGIIDSFQPLLQFEKGEWSLMMFFARIFCAILTAGSLYKLSETHSPSSVANFAKQQFLDVLDWGHQRLASPADHASGYASISDKSANEDTDDNTGESAAFAGDEEDYSCLKNCGYTTFNQLMSSKCLMKCDSMQELNSSTCFSECPFPTQSALKEYEKDACTAEVERKKRREEDL